MWKGNTTVIPFFVKLCSDKAAYELKLQRKIDFTMERLEQQCEATKKFEIVVSTPYVTIMRTQQGAEVTLSKDGRILIKEVLIESEAREIAAKVLQFLLDRSNR